MWLKTIMNCAGDRAWPSLLELTRARTPLAANSAAIIAAVEAGKCEGYICATTVTAIQYLTAKALGRKQAEAHMPALLGIFRIAAVNEAVLSAALKSELPN